MEMSIVDRQVVERYLEIILRTGFNDGIVERVSLYTGLPRGRVHDVLSDYHKSKKEELWVN